jgi:hypothetical protein
MLGDAGFAECVETWGEIELRVLLTEKADVLVTSGNIIDFFIPILAYFVKVFYTSIYSLLLIEFLC